MTDYNDRTHLVRRLAFRAVTVVAVIGAAVEVVVMALWLDSLRRYGVFGGEIGISADANRDH